jgi:hypothetical protein
MENFKIRHSGLDPESSFSFWIPAFPGMTLLELLVFYIT